MKSSATGDLELRQSIVQACRAMSAGGLSYGTSGNVSVRRDAAGFFVSPSGMAYENLEPLDVPLVTFSGEWFGRRKPSSEWRFHRDILSARADTGAIMHTHSRYATALACTGQGIPAFHYMVAVAGGADIRCAPHAAFGSQMLSDHALRALEGRKACLLANLLLAGEVENLATQYYAALQSGEPVLLDNAEMDRVLEKFRTYARQDEVEEDLAFGTENIPGVKAKS